MPIEINKELEKTLNERLIEEFNEEGIRINGVLFPYEVPKSEIEEERY